MFLCLGAQKGPPYRRDSLCLGSLWGPLGCSVGSRAFSSLFFWPISLMSSTWARDAEPRALVWVVCLKPACFWANRQPPVNIKPRFQEKIIYINVFLLVPEWQQRPWPPTQKGGRRTGRSPLISHPDCVAKSADGTG